MASISMMSYISTVKPPSKFLFDHRKLVPKKFHVARVTNSLSDQLVAKKLATESQNNPIPELKVDEYIPQKIELINKALDEAIPVKYPELLHEAMRYTVLARNNRIHPMLCIASCDLVGGDESMAMATACAVEILFTVGEIVDDLPCLDNDDLRRGKPANHNVFGEGTTVLASQGLIYFAIEHILTKTKHVSPDRLNRVIVEICSALGSEGIAAGQIMDITSEGKEVSLSDLELIHRHKTGKLIEASVVCGALVGGGTEEEIERLRKYGKYVGVAHQVWDDILDVSGNTEELGKKVGRDLERDKATYPKLMGLEGAKNHAKELEAQAFKELAYFDSPKADPLYRIANFVVSRRQSLKLYVQE
ncbi:Geranylgeranyl pyrophosphate synthase [Melia azedarach]|uniref:Geranylgeranyl pyrophosphate synthase n=1 Tax=Melia azedarach TaxID=155640 RepID=A0ACC1X893_MELAZ|nr:Geranylgeranyl pyrophosphate synthase [Melia azedarach]